MSNFIPDFGPDPETYVTERAETERVMSEWHEQQLAKQAAQDLARQVRLDQEQRNRDAAYEQTLRPPEQQVAQVLQMRRLQVASELPSFLQIFERADRIIDRAPVEDRKDGCLKTGPFERSRYSSEIILAENKELRQAVTITTEAKRNRIYGPFEPYLATYEPKLIDTSQKTNHSFRRPDGVYVNLSSHHFGNTVHVEPRRAYEDIDASYPFDERFRDLRTTLYTAKMDDVLTLAEQRLGIA